MQGMITEKGFAEGWSRESLSEEELERDVCGIKIKSILNFRKSPDGDYTIVTMVDLEEVDVKIVPYSKFCKRFIERLQEDPQPKKKELSEKYFMEEYRLNPHNIENLHVAKLLANNELEKEYLITLLRDGNAMMNIDLNKKEEFINDLVEFLPDRFKKIPKELKESHGNETLFGRRINSIDIYYLESDATISFLTNYGSHFNSQKSLKEFNEKLEKITRESKFPKPKKKEVKVEETEKIRDTRSKEEMFKDDCKKNEIQPEFYYIYKGKSYKVLGILRFKDKGTWISIIHYEPRQRNNHGYDYSRNIGDFKNKFKISDFRVDTQGKSCWDVEKYKPLSKSFPKEPIANVPPSLTNYAKV